MRPVTPCRIEILVDRAAAAYPERPAIIHGARVWTYADLAAETLRRAAVLIARGLEPGAVVLTTEMEMDDVEMAFLACCRADLAFVRLSAKLTAAEVAPLAARIGVRLALTADGTPHPMLPHLPALLLSLPGPPPATAYDAVARRSATGDVGATALMQTTSGTTGGRAKIVPTTHRMLTWRSASLARWEQEAGVWYRTPPDAPSFRGFCDVLAAGGTWVGARTTDPRAMEAEMAARGVRVLRTVPTVVRMLVEQRQPPPPNLALAIVRTGAATLPPEIAAAARKRYGAETITEYASTEAGTLFVAVHRRMIAASIGVPVRGVRARIVDERGDDVPDGAVGELLVRAPGLMRGYLDDPEATARVLTDGWLRTGDLARRDAKGRFFLAGRAALRISVGGLKVSSEEVEAVLQQHPAVREAVVLGAPDAARGEIVRAVIVPAGPPPRVAELRRFCRKRLAGYKVPRRWEFRDDLPRSPLGKPLRSAL